MAQCLATLTQHTRPVNCVRWAASSQRLASASDDNLALVWVLKPRDANRQFGNLEEKQVENWRLFGRLQGHSHGRCCHRAGRKALFLSRARAASRLTREFGTQM
eukprot:COSAG02_NODE_5096_length_4629_cov_21.108955_2_plen_104_part_00